MLKSEDDISVKIGLAPVAITALAVALKLNEGIITSSPVFISRDRSDANNAEVPEFTATACLTFKYF